MSFDRRTSGIDPKEAMRSSIYCFSRVRFSLDDSWTGVSYMEPTDIKEIKKPGRLRARTDGNIVRHLKIIARHCKMLHLV